MSPALKNRLVGTVIIVAIAVIFLPDLLDGKKETKRNLFVDLPEKPQMKQVKAPSEFNTDKIKQASTRKIEVLTEQAVDEEPKAVSEGDTETVLDVKIPDNVEQDRQIEDPSSQLSLDETVTESGAKTATKSTSLAAQTVVHHDQDKLLAGAGWVVQLGSFRHQKNVKELLAKLEKAGYRAFSRPVKTSSGNLTKVFVGPDLDKQKLTTALSHLKQLTNLQGRVTPFTVQ
ncbi:SPOR domain-containing protein [Paraglaciecola aquimarina]|uniref:SPOR domain-containing protein n=1 Tax=Paraglaciecola algarum TaxID=3050085 RepID=A0ABS9D4U6_9ALTE|nr:SPOR domain-containing protein [Paraglaciecola sp. G1-23]MCF2946721.1 SPOR domain-containing protein [Paraglaciecola sp. G1-23]